MKYSIYKKNLIPLKRLSASWGTSLKADILAGQPAESATLRLKQIRWLKRGLRGIVMLCQYSVVAVGLKYFTLYKL